MFQFSFTRFVFHCVYLDESALIAIVFNSLSILFSTVLVKYAEASSMEWSTRKPYRCGWRIWLDSE